MDLVHRTQHQSVSKKSPRRAKGEGFRTRPHQAMATAAAGGARRALAGLRSASAPRTFSRPSAAATAQSPGPAASSLPRAPHRRLAISRVPVAALGGVQGLMPLHSATASALLTSMLGLKPGSWGWLSEGFATPL
uniref:Uncharacterized protein n=1 Tax=Leersia perrieri TaxID=77586 RepID=A0A0D9V5E6_9ORYZ